MGTVAGTLTRSYHGLLIAALEPPVARRLLVPSVQLEVQYRGTAYALATNRWASGGRAPEGWRFIESFAVVDGVPQPRWWEASRGATCYTSFDLRVGKSTGLRTTRFCRDTPKAPPQAAKRPAVGSICGRLVSWSATASMSKNRAPGIWASANRARASTDSVGR